ncbi:hypothetical protein ACQEVF_45415 [Nonomuraea polychroma]|uniref:hypothetical protein n=1 Tax=Nonomuraea polychroma TaxID=46176 RepID=UPI003D9194FC
MMSLVTVFTPATIRPDTDFKTASAELGPHRQGWTLHQLRHSALQHLAQAGRPAPELRAKSRYQPRASLGRDVRLGEETSARITAEHDPAARAAPVAMFLIALVTGSGWVTPAQSTASMITHDAAPK